MSEFSPPQRQSTRSGLYFALSTSLSVFVACHHASAALTYTVGGSWPNDAHRTAAVIAIQLVIDRYNAYGDFGNANVYVYYNAGIPTAQASYNGSIGFGGTYPNERVMAHEMAHYLGLPSGNWGSLMTGGSWDGAYGLAKVRQFDGEQATINGDGIHFWPYGLNYDTEGSELNKQRQVELVYAMRADLGIGSAVVPGARRDVRLTADNPAGESGFNFKNQWSDGYNPHVGAVYYTDNYLLRTPAAANSYKFYGGPLVVNNTDGAAGGLHFYGQGSAATVTIDDLRLDGGWVQHTSAAGSLFQLAGRVHVQANSTIRAKQGNIDLLADVIGAGDLTIETTDLPDQNDRYVRFRSASNTFTGDLINLSRFELAAGANFRFAVGASGSSNAITGPTARATLLNGTFDLDLSAASFNAGDSWALVTAANATYGSSFQVAGFTNSSGIWSNGAYSFNQTTGLLTIAPNWNVDGGGNWSEAGNWLGGVPLAAGEATFGAVLTPAGAPAAVNVDAPTALHRLTFDNVNSYVLNGSQPITLVGGASIVAKSGSHKIGVPIAGSAGLNTSGPGIIELTAANNYTGDTHVHSGTLRLSAAGAMANTTNIRVHSAATLDTTNLAAPFTLATGQSLQLDDDATHLGNVTAAAGSTISGQGRVVGNLSAQNAALLRVGGAGLPTAATANQLARIDDFQEDAPGKLSDGATSGVWSSVPGGTDNAQVASDSGNNSLEYYGTGSAWRGVRTSLRSSFGPADHSLAHGDNATYFFRVQRRGTQTIDGIFGLTDLESIGADAPWQELAVTLSLFQGTATGDTTSLRAYDGDGGGDVVIRNNVASNEWLNVWLLVDNQAKTYQVATSTGADAGTLFPNTFQFGRQAAAGAALDTFAGAEYRAIPGTRNASAVRLDNFYRLDGSDLAHPLAIVGQTLTIEGDLALTSPDITLALDLATPSIHDRLVITGAAHFAGILDVALQAGFSLTIGQAFDLFDFTSATGAFDRFDLPALAAGLRWDVSQLTTTGAIAVAPGLAGDFNADGRVDSADYTHWRDRRGQTEDAVTLAGNGSRNGLVDQADYELWRANFGNIGGAAALSEAHHVPEPTAAFLFLTAMLSASLLRRSASPTF